MRLAWLAIGLCLLLASTSTAEAQRRRRTPDPAPAPVASTGTLVVTVVQEGAEVYVDEQLVGTSPVAPQTLEPGSHTVRVRMPGYSEYSDVVTVERGGMADMPVELFALSEALSITTTPPGAHVFVDGNFAGETPVEIDLVDGAHSVRVTLHGYEEIVREVTAESGRREELALTMEAIPEDQLRGAEWYEEPVTWIAVGGGVVAAVVIIVVVVVATQGSGGSQIDAFCGEAGGCVRVDTPFLLGGTF
jgi:hypothetical protein